MTTFTLAVTSDSCDTAAMAESPDRKHLRRWGHTGELRFLTFSCHRRLPLLGHPAWRTYFAECLDRARTTCGFKLIAWVVMPEHVHLIIVPKQDNQPVSSILRAIKQPVAERALRRWKSTNAPILRHLVATKGFRYWQAGGGFDRLIRTREEFWREREYIHYNPVKRGLVEHPTEWAWSSARWYAGERQGVVPIDEVAV